MGTKVYFLVETDESNAVPISRLMSQLVDQANHGPQNSHAKSDLPINEGAVFNTIPLRPIDPNRVMPSQPKCRKESVSSTEQSLIALPTVQRLSLSCPEPASRTQAVKPNVVTETLVDQSGQARTKIVYNSETGANSGYEDSAHEIQTAKKRNGLDPSSYGLHGKKLVYVPIIGGTAKEIGSARRCQRLPIFCSMGSAASINSRDYYQNTVSPVVAEMKKCAKNIPESRLIKYNACITRRDGMQDNCDPLSRKALKKCCKK